MIHFLLNCLKPEAILMLFIAAECLVGYTLPGYQAHSGYRWVLWLFVGVLSAISWVFLVGS